MMWTTLGIVLFFVRATSEQVVTSRDPTPTEDYLHSVELDESETFFLFWKFDSETITLEVHARTLGWVGLGLSTNGKMEGADIVIGGVLPDGQSYFQDRYGVGNEMPTVDEEQDYELLQARQTEEFTMLKFRRPLQLCHAHDRTIKEDTFRVIFAWGETDEIEYHTTRRGTKSVLLLDYNLPDQEHRQSVNTLKYFDLRMNKVAVPTKRTTYMCRIVKMPELSRKHHIVKMEPLIENRNRGVVHHIVTYFCHGQLAEQAYGQECYEGNMPDNVTSCDTMSFAWAVGMGDYYLPREAGMAIGEVGGSIFASIEMHYDNPQHLEGIIDSSGIRMYYTEDLRQHDVGLFMIGHSVWWPPMAIPPKANHFRVDGFCGRDCTSKIPEEGITVFSSFLHTHLKGSAMWIRHLRDGRELPEIVRDDAYDFNFQTMREIKETAKILPGDEMITSCGYNTEGTTNMTFGGLGTDNEMCLAFLFYYPRVDLVSCISTSQAYYPIHQLLMQKAMNGEVSIDPNADAKSTYDYLDRLNWDDEKLQRTFQRLVDDTPGFVQFCTSRNEGSGVLGGGGSYYAARLAVDKPLQRRDNCTEGQKQSDGSSALAAAPLTFALCLAALYARTRMIQV